MLAFACRAFIATQPHAECVCRLETGFVAIVSAQESIWSFDSGCPSAADIVMLRPDTQLDRL